MQKIYIAISIGALAIVAALLVFIKKQNPKTKLSPLTGLAFAFIIAGTVFGESRLVGYGLMGTGILIALVDVFKKLKK